MPSGQAQERGARGSATRWWVAVLSGFMAAIGALALMLLSMGRDWVWPDGSDWQALWTFATFVVATAAAVIAISQLRAHHAAQWELSRPYVIVDWRFRSTLIIVEVRNAGSTTARDVELEWSPRLVAGDRDRAEVIERNLVQGTIPFLAPGRVIRHLLGTWEECCVDGDVPRYEVAVSYRDVTGRQIDGEVMVLDLGQWAEALADSDYDDKNWNESKRQTEARKATVKAVHAVVSELDRLNAALEARAAAGEQA